MRSLSELARDWRATHRVALPRFQLDAAMKQAWDNPGKWIPTLPETGVKAVICKPKTTKAGYNIWLWGYQLTTHTIIWRATRRPLEVS